MDLARLTIGVLVLAHVTSAATITCSSPPQTEQIFATHAKSGNVNLSAAQTATTPYIRRKEDLSYLVLHITALAGLIGSDKIPL